MRIFSSSNLLLYSYNNLATTNCAPGNASLTFRVFEKAWSLNHLIFIKTKLFYLVLRTTNLQNVVFLATFFMQSGAVAPFGCGPCRVVYPAISSLKMRQRHTGQYYLLSIYRMWYFSKSVAYYLLLEYEHLRAREKILIIILLLIGMKVSIRKTD